MSESMDRLSSTIDAAIERMDSLTRQVERVADALEHNESALLRKALGLACKDYVGECQPNGGRCSKYPKDCDECWPVHFINMAKGPPRVNERRNAKRTDR